MFDVHYQPIVTTASGHVAAWEALLRPRRGAGTLSPATVIAEAESSGEIIALGRQITARVMSDLACQSRSTPHTVSINVSPSEMIGEEYLAGLAAAADRSNVSLAQIWIEITETAPIRDLGAVRATLIAARELGITVCIDDFGQGWTCIDELDRLPVDIVKIDRRAFGEARLCGTCRRHPHHTQIGTLETIAEMLVNRSVRIVAEGVENDRMHRRAVLSGCTYSQGWFHGHPRPARHAFQPAQRMH